MRAARLEFSKCVNPLRVSFINQLQFQPRAFFAGLRAAEESAAEWLLAQVTK
jgi:hypothetical protein